MRLLRFSLHAFGPFSETELDLSGPARGGLHVIFGLNEAGKSTALRAVSALLFGIGERTLDAHSHPARELRLGALLEEGGRQLAFLRRKRRKDSLRTLDDEPLSETELEPFLHGVDATVFHSLFGLDHERLKLGGQALLNGQGDVGESLFDAGTGGSGIHAVLADLARECDGLFKARASKPSLNAAVAEYRAAKKKSRDEVRAPEKYLEQLAAVERAKAQRQALTAERAALRERQERVERILGTQPLVQRRQQYKSDLARLGQVPHLPEDVTTERRELQQLIAECTRDIERSEREIQRRRSELAAMPPDTELCELAKHTFDELRDKVGIHRKAARDLPNVRGQIKQAEADAARILVRMGKPADLEAAEALRLDTARIARIRRLARERAVLFQRQESARERLARAEQELAEKRRALAACGPEVEVFGLTTALGEARGLALVEQRLSELELTLAAEQRRFAELGRRLFPEADLGFEAALGSAAPPELEVIESFEAELSKLDAGREQLEAELEHAARERAEAERHVRAIERQGEVPSERELALARERRDLVLRELVRESHAGALGAQRIEEYEGLVSAADALADRLRREATRVAELAQWSVAFEHWQRRSAELAGLRQAALDARKDFAEAWRRAWAALPVTPRSPREMLAWRRRFDELQAIRSNLARLEHERARLGERRATCLEQLRRELAGAPEASSLAALVELASDRLQAIEQGELRRRTLSVEVQQLATVVEREATALEVSAPPLAAWQAAWAEAVSPLGLGNEPGTDEVLAVLDDSVELAQKLDELPHNRRRVAGMERDARAFEAALKPLVARFAPDLACLPVDEAAERLAERYQAAVTERQTRARLVTELEEREAELQSQSQRLASLSARERALLVRAGAADLDELERLEERWRAARELGSKLHDLEDQLIAQGGGLSLEQMIADATAIDPTALRVEKEELRVRLEDTEKAAHDVAIEIDRLERGLEYYTDETAALAAQQQEQRAAQVRELLERYLRVRLARTVLEREIARYRERHQGPVLSRASELFQRLTLDRYRGLRVGREERSLGCVRADGDEVGVAQLSEGTQYQLYLALRLATLEHYVQDGASIPLVFDDALIHFDDERAAAAFGVLGELAERVQILYFTHLSRDLRLSEQAVSAALLRHHRLSASRPASGELRADGAQ